MTVRVRLEEQSFSLERKKKSGGSIIAGVMAGKWRRSFG